MQQTHAGMHVHMFSSGRKTDALAALSCMHACALAVAALRVPVVFWWRLVTASPPIESLLPQLATAGSDKSLVALGCNEGLRRRRARCCCGGHSQRWSAAARQSNATAQQQQRLRDAAVCWRA